jgi:Protein of unknown function (DUF4054)
MPDLGQIIDGWWGGAYQTPGLSGIVASAANIAIGVNPAFTATDFLAIYPKFGGSQFTVITATGTLAASSPTVTGIPTTGLAVGQLIAGSGIPGGTTIAALGANTVTLSQNATASGAQTLTVWPALLVPLVVLNLYIALASASLNQAKWQDAWQTGMALYVAHFATLWLQSEGDPVSAAGQAAANGLSRGIVVSKSVGDVSISTQPYPGYEDWGAFQQTVYGQQLISLAKVIGWGPVYLW